MKIIFLDMDGVMNSMPFLDVNSKRAFRRRKAEAHIHRDTRRSEAFLNFVAMIDPVAVKRLNALIERTGAKVVISSSWRIYWTPEEMALMFARFGFDGEIVGRTPDLTRTSAGRIYPEERPVERGEEIALWLTEHPEVTSFVIFDDCGDMATLRHRFVQTTLEAGLTDEHVELAVEMLTH